MSYSFCFGPSGAGKSHYLRQYIIEKAQASMQRRDTTRYIMIVPEQYTLQTQRELVADHPAHVIMNIDVLSFGRLAYRVFAKTGADQKRVLDDIGKTLLLRRVASRCGKDLKVLGRGIHRPGMIDEVKSIVSEFMQYGIGPEEIRAMGAYAAENGQRALELRLKDIELLFAAFQEAEQEHYVTAEEALDLLAGAIPGAADLQDAVIVFDGFTGFTTTQYKVVMALLRCAREVVFSFTASQDGGPDPALCASGGPQGSEEDLFYLTRRTVSDIVRMASKEGISRGQNFGNDHAHDQVMHAGIPRFGKNRVLAHLERYIFRYPEVPFAEAYSGETGRTIRLLSATTPQEEVRQIFGQIRETIAETGCAYRDFAIVTADLDTYGDLFAVEAERSGIPVYIDRTSGVFQNILIEGIRSVLQISAESFSYSAVFRYLRSGLSRLSAEEADRLENYCLANGVRGRKRWALPFDASCEEARLRFLEEVSPVTGAVAGREAGSSAVREKETGPAAVMGKETGPAAVTEKETGPAAVTEKETGSADVTGKGTADLKSTARRAPRTVAVRTRELHEFLLRCEAQACMDQWAAFFGEKGDEAAAKQYEQIYRAVIDLLDQIYELAGEEQISARDYLELLEAGFTQIRLGTLPQKVDRILVGDMERTRLTQIRHLFFAGTNEGAIPRSASRGGILSDMDREFLAGGGAVLSPTPRQQMFTQRLYLYMNLTKPSETLTVSYAGTAQDGRSLRPSYLVSLLQSLFPQVRTEIPQLRRAQDRITDPVSGFRVLAELLRRRVEGTTEDFDGVYGFFTSREVMADPDTSRTVMQLRKAAFYRYRPQYLQRELADALYDNRIYGGITRMETAARCMLRHHLRYGLRLQERDLYEFQAVDSGTVLHASLQRFHARLSEEGISWTDFSPRDALRLCAAVLEEESAQYRNQIMYKSSRDANRLSRYLRRLLRTVDTLQYQIRRGDLRPAASELGFGGHDGEMPAITFDLPGGGTLSLTGRIDRVDAYTDGDGTRFLRIMDYKSGKNELDPELIRRGLQLQLISYMEALLKVLPPEQKAVPAAMNYYQMADPVLRLPAAQAMDVLRSAVPSGVPAEEYGTGEILQEQTDRIRRELRPTGLVCENEGAIAHLHRDLSGRSDVIPVSLKKDGSLMAGSRTYTTEAYRSMAEDARNALCALAEEILRGNISAEPAKIDQKKTGCSFCPFLEACGFDLRTPGYRLRTEAETYKQE